MACAWRAGPGCSPGATCAAGISLELASVLCSASSDGRQCAWAGSGEVTACEQLAKTRPVCHTGSEPGRFVPARSVLTPSQLGGAPPHVWLNHGLNKGREQALVRSAAELASALVGRRLLFMGDSMVRQIFARLICALRGQAVCVEVNSEAPVQLYTWSPTHDEYEYDALHGAFNYSGDCRPKKAGLRPLCDVLLSEEMLRRFAATRLSQPPHASSGAHQAALGPSRGFELIFVMRRHDVIPALPMAVRSLRPDLTAAGLFYWSPPCEQAALHAPQVCEACGTRLKECRLLALNRESVLDATTAELVAAFEEQAKAPGVEDARGGDAMGEATTEHHRGRRISAPSRRLVWLTAPPRQMDRTPFDWIKAQNVAVHSDAEYSARNRRMRAWTEALSQQLRSRRGGDVAAASVLDVARMASEGEAEEAEEAAEDAPAPGHGADGDVPSWPSVQWLQRNEQDRTHLQCGWGGLPAPSGVTSKFKAPPLLNGSAGPMTAPQTAAEVLEACAASFNYAVGLRLVEIAASHPRRCTDADAGADTASADNAARADAPQKPVAVPTGPTEDAAGPSADQLPRPRLSSALLSHLRKSTAAACRAGAASTAQIFPADDVFVTRCVCSHRVAASALPASLREERAKFNLSFHSRAWEFSGLHDLLRRREGQVHMRSGHFGTSLPLDLDFTAGYINVGVPKPLHTVGVAVPAVAGSGTRRQIDAAQCRFGGFDVNMVHSDARPDRAKLPWQERALLLGVDYDSNIGHALHEVRFLAAMLSAWPTADNVGTGGGAEGNGDGHGVAPLSLPLHLISRDAAPEAFGAMLRPSAPYAAWLYSKLRKRYGTTELPQDPPSDAGGLECFPAVLTKASCLPGDATAGTAIRTTMYASCGLPASPAVTSLLYIHREAPSDAKHGRRLGIDYSGSTRVVRNEREVLDALQAVAAQRGLRFEAVYTGSSTPCEQVALFARARLVVSVHGASLSGNLVFLQPRVSPYVLEMTMCSAANNHFFDDTVTLGIGYAPICFCLGVQDQVTAPGRANSRGPAMKTKTGWYHSGGWFHSHWLYARVKSLVNVANAALDNNPEAIATQVVSAGAVGGEVPGSAVACRVMNDTRAIVKPSLGSMTIRPIPACDAASAPGNLNCTIDFTFAGGDNCSERGWSSPAATALTPGTVHAWQLSSGKTHSLGTGPSAGLFGFGFYWYTEASSPTKSSDGSLPVYELAYDASVASECRAGGGVESISFSYHMFGSAIGELKVVGSDGATRWRRSGNQNDVWRASGDVAIGSSRFAFVHTKASSGIWYQADAAVADVRVRCGASTFLSD